MIQLTNDYEQNVFNGDVGVVSEVLPAQRGARFKVRFDNRDSLARGDDGADAADDEGGIEVEYSAKALDRDVALSYALTVHKAQGSEYPVVVVPVLPQQGRMLYRNLFYTGISRAKQLLVLVGSEAAIHSAIDSVDSSRRDTLLSERVQNHHLAPPSVRHE